MEKKGILKLYYALAGAIFVIYALLVLAVFLDVPFYRGVYPPPIAITLFLFFNWIGILIGVMFHVGIFLLGNIYLIRRHYKKVVLVPIRACTPSLLGISAIVILSLWYWLGGGIRYGLKYHGFNYVLTYGLLNVFALGALIISIFIIIHRSIKQRLVLTEHIWMVYNFCIHVSILTVLFPYLGEMP